MHETSVYTIQNGCRCSYTTSKKHPHKTKSCIYHLKYSATAELLSFPFQCLPYPPVFHMRAPHLNNMILQSKALVVRSYFILLIKSTIYLNKKYINIFSVPPILRVFSQNIGIGTRCPFFCLFCVFICMNILQNCTASRLILHRVSLPTLPPSGRKKKKK